MHHDKPEEVVVLAGVFRLLAEFVFKRVVASFAFAVPSYNIVVIYIQFIEYKYSWAYQFLTFFCIKCAENSSKWLKSPKGQLYQKHLENQK